MRRDRQHGFALTGEWEAFSYDLCAASPAVITRFAIRRFFTKSVDIDEMSPLQKQVVLRFCATFMSALVVMTLVIVAYDTAQRLFREGLSLYQTVCVFPYLFPAIARTAMQGATLFAVCLVYGHMAAKNELLALSASGISLANVVWPIVALSVLMSFAGIWLEDFSNTWGENGFRRSLANYTVDIAYRRLQTQGYYSTADLKLTAFDVKGRTLIQPTIKKMSADLQQCVDIKAETGHIELDRQSSNLLVVLENGTYASGDIRRLSFKGRFVHAVPLTWKPSFATSLARIREQETRIAELTAALHASTHGAEENTAVRIPLLDPYDPQAVALSTAENSLGQTRSPSVTQANWSLRVEGEDTLRNERTELFWRRSLWHQKWANSFCCLTFALVGIPIATSFRRSDPLSSFLVCFLPVLAVYQPLQYLGMAYSVRGLISPLWLHVNNLLLAGCGIWRLSYMR